ncbi:hypothetical protein Godav_013656, partial [Gossypium davidsonii]|nr:hypothetical protein [Gossypium davidsonii]MBA0648359.1 hypothetical protein [Gossypium klotzschianum]
GFRPSLENSVRGEGESKRSSDRSTTFGDLVWKRIKLTSTRKANAKKHLHRIWQ